MSVPGAEQLAGLASGVTGPALEVGVGVVAVDLFRLAPPEEARVNNTNVIESKSMPAS